LLTNFVVLISDIDELDDSQPRKVSRASTSKAPLRKDSVNESPKLIEEFLDFFYILLLLQEKSTEKPDKAISNTFSLVNAFQVSFC
jgi:hypothetical protein